MYADARAVTGRKDCVPVKLTLILCGCIAIYIQLVLYQFEVIPRKDLYPRIALLIIIFQFD